MHEQTRISRRKFLSHSAVGIGGLVIAFHSPGLRRIAQAAVDSDVRFEPNAFLEIDQDDNVNILLAHSEMGQGVWTALPMLVAEELGADWTTLSVRHAPAKPVYAHPILHMMGTGSSLTMISEFDRYRQAGAVARELLLQAASEKSGTAKESCTIENGIVDCGRTQYRFSELVEEASRLEVPESVELKDKSDWKVIGKPTNRLDSPEKVSGKARFGMDVQFEGLRTAIIARPPTFGATAASVDDSAAMKVPGVNKVVTVPSGVAVVAEHYWAAKQGVDALQIEWDVPEESLLDSSALIDGFRKLAEGHGDTAARRGDSARMLAASEDTLEFEFVVPYLAHAPMEPMNCAVRLSDGKAELWTGTQFQTVSQLTTGHILGISPENVELTTMFLGGGFGRRSPLNSDYVSDAVHVAKEAGLSVKTVWTREDDIRGGNYRPAFVHRARIDLDESGYPRAWDHVMVGQSIAQGTAIEEMLVHDGVDHLSIEGCGDSSYLEAIPNHHFSLHTPKTSIPVLWWRSVGHSHSAFVMESVMDELAHRSGIDSVDYRRNMLGHSPRHLGVLEAVVEKSGYGSALGDGRAHGLAIHFSYGSYVGQIAEVSVDENRIVVHKITCVVDCGVAVNPETIKAQMESSVAWGLSAALRLELNIDNGRVRQSNFHDYEVLRFNEMPVVDVHILDSEENLGGIGEPGVPPVAPAVANAVYKLTGQRLRQLPLRLA